MIDAGKLELTHALAQAMDGAVEAPEAVILVYEGRGMWVNPDVLHALACGLADIDLAPGSRVGAIEFSTGASTRIPDGAGDPLSTGVSSARRRTTRRSAAAT